MSSASLTVKQKLANGFVIFTAIWSSAIMPVIPSYAKMLDNNDLPSLASEHNVTEDNTERLVAEYSKTLGTFLSQKKNSQDLSDMAQNYARNKVANEATKEIENWLSKAGNARLNIDIDKNFSIKNSQLDWLIPWYDQPQALLFTQHSIHRSDERLHVNNGIGLRHFNEKNTIGINAFIDHDISRAHTRAGLGVEYWQDYLKLNANGYLGLTSWKSASELNHDYNAKPANGWDIQVESWLPAYPHLGGNLKYEQYYGDSVALFGKTKRQKDPNAATIGAHWTPFPLFTLNANHKFGSKKQSETQAKLQFTWIFGKSLAHHLDPTKVAEARRLSGNRYDFVERNNSIILDYQKKTLLKLSLPAKIQGEAGLSVSLVKSFTSKYPLKHIEWNAPELLAAGGSISSIDQTAVLILPSYKTANTAQGAQKANRYRLRATAYDIKGNASPVAETLVEVTHSGVVSINPRDITFYGAGLANGNDINGLTAIVRDSHGNVAPNAKVVFVLPNTLALVAQKANTAARSDIQRDLRKKMQAMKVAKPVEYTTTTNAKGEAQVQFTSQIAGAYEISVYTGNHPPVKTQVTFIPDVADAYIHNFTVSLSGVIADGVSTHSISALIMDKNKNPIPNYDVNFSATNAKIIDKAKTDENGLVEVTLTSVKAGASEVTLSINGHSETKAVEFISGQAHQIAVLEVQEVFAGRESQISFQLLDSLGNPIIDATDDITVIIDKKANSTPIWDTDIDKGIYAANISGQQSGEHTIQVVMDKLTSPERTFTTLGASSIKSTKADGSGVTGTLGVIASIEIDITPDQTSFKSGDSPLIMVTLKDSFGNEIENVDFNHIHLGDLKGKDLAWRDEGHSDYVVNLPLTTVGNIDITANVNGIFSPKTVLTVSHNSSISSIDHVVVTPVNPSPNAGDKPTLKIELTDSNGNTVNDVKQVDVTIDGQKQTLPVTQNPDGSYTVELPAQHSGSKDIQVSVNGKDSNNATLTVQAPTSTAANTSGNAGEQGVLATVELTTGSLANLKSGDTLALTVTAKDAFDNPLTGLATAITLSHNQAGAVAWTDNQDGTYTASLPLSKLGSDTLNATVNTISASPITLNVDNAAGNTHIQTVVVTPTNPSPNAGDKPTLKVELTDSHGNTVNDVKQVEVTIDGQKQALPVTQNPDGSYTVELPAQHSGNKGIQVTVNGKGSNQATLTVQAPTSTVANTSGNAGEQGVLATVELTTGSLANLKSGDTLALTVTAKDAFDNPLTGLATAITLSHNQAGAVAWTDNQDGTYTASLPLSKLGSDTLNATVNTISASPITLNVDNAAGNTHIQTVVVTPTNPSPNAGDKPTLKVELTDSHGNTVNDVKQVEVTIDGQKQALPVTQNPDGSYTVELPAQHSGSKDIQVTVNGKDSNQATLTVQAPTPTLTNTSGNAGEQGVLATVELTTGLLANLKSGDTLALTVTAKDAFDNPLTGLAAAITLSHNQAGAVAWTDNQDGTYTASLALSKLGSDTLTTTVNAVSSNPISLTVDNAAGNTHIQTVVVTPTNPSPNAGDKPTLKIELTDSNGNTVNDVKQVDVTIDGQKQTLPVTQNPDGSYTVELPAQHSGSKDIQVSVNGKDSNNATLTVQAPTSTAANTSGNAGEQGVLATVELTTGSLANLKSGDTLALTVTAKDAFDNPLTGLATAITLSHNQAGAVAWTDNQDGTYTASLPLSKLGSDTLNATVNTISASPITLNVDNAAGNTHIQTVVVTPTNPSPNAGDKPTLKIELTDSNGNTVNDVKQVDVTIDGQKQTLPVTQNPDGSYTVELPAQHSGNKGIQVTVNGKGSNQATLTVQAPTSTAANTSGNAGEQGVLATVELTTGLLANLKSGDTLALTVTAKDSFKNPLTGLASAIALNHNQAGSVTWIDNQDGTYSGTLTLTKLGSDTLNATVNAIASQPTSITVNPQQGKASVVAVELHAQSPIISAGQSTTLTLTLRDKHDNGVVQIPSNDIKLEDNKLALSNIQWQEQGNGVYTTSIMFSEVRTHSLTAGIGQFTEATNVIVNSPTGKDAVKAIAIAPVASSDAGQPSSLSINLTDQYKNPVKNVDNNDITVTINGQKQNIIFIENNASNKYTAQLPASKANRYKIVVEINGQSETTEWVVNSPIAIPISSYTQDGLRGSLETISITHNAKNHTVNSGDKVTLSVELKDKFDNQLTGAAGSLKLLTNLQSASAWKELSSGLYTQELTMDKLNKQSIEVKADKMLSNKLELDIAQVKGASHVHKTTLETNVNAIEAGKEVILTLTLMDTVNNGVIGVDTNDIQLSNNGKPTVATWAHSQDGVYTTKMHLDIVGNYQFKASVNNQSTSIKTVDVTAPRGANVVSTAQITANVDAFDAGEKIELTLVLKDQYGNLVTDVNAADITLKDSHTSETFDSSKIVWQMASIGEYKAVLPVTKVGKHTLTATVNKQSVDTNEITVKALKGTSHVKKIELITTKTSIKAGESTELTLTLLDSYGNEVADIMPNDIKLKNSDNAITTTASWVKTPSHESVYTANATLEKVKQHTLSVDVGNQTKNIEIEVKPLEGARHVTSVALNMPVAARLGANTPLILQLKDKFGNGVTHVASQDIQLTNNGQVESTTWNEGLQGQYTANWLSTKVGKHQLDVIVNTNRLVRPFDIELMSPKGAENVDNIKIDMLDTTNTGDIVKITLKLQDKYGIDVLDVSPSDITLSSDKQALSSLVWRDDKHGNYSTDVTLDKAGKHTLTVTIRNSAKTTAKKELTIKALPPVFGNGKSELSIDTDSVEGNGKDKATITLKLIDRNNSPISGINPTLTISNGALGNMVMKETSTSGVYSAAISNPNESKVIVTLDPNSIGYVGAKQEIDIYFYSFQDINYPLNSVTNQQFIKFGYKNDDYSSYTWENSYPDVIGINSTSSLYIKGRPKPQENVITLIARPKKNSHQLKAIRATITVDKFIYSSKDTTQDQHTVAQLCKNDGSRLATIDEVRGLYKTPSGTLNLLLDAPIYSKRHWIDSNSGYISHNKVDYPTLGVPTGNSLPVVCTVDY